jgi:hypothetical protein
VALRSPAGADVLLTLAVTLAGALVARLAIEVGGDYVNVRRDRVLVVLAGLMVVVLALPARRVAWGVAALAATWIAGWLAFTTIPDDVFIETPVDQAAGGAAYYATPYIPQQLAGGVLEAAVLLAALGYVLVGARRRWWPPERAQQRAEAQPRAGLVTAAGVALAAVTIVPDLSTVALGDPLGPYKANDTLAGWDISNLITWQWLLDAGAVPMKDFFWPYGQTWVHSVFPLGSLWAWLSNCATLALASWALWRLSPPEGRAARVVLCALALVVVGVWQLGIWRYGVPVVLALVYAAVGPGSHRRPSPGHAVLALAALYTALWGVDMFIYGVGGMAFVLLGELLAGRVTLRPVGPLIRGLAVDGLALLAVLVVPLWWVIQGSFDGNARFAFGLRGVSAASAAAQNQLGALREFIGFKPTYDMLANVAPALLLAAGLAHALLGGRRAATLSRVLVAAGGVCFAVLLKHLVRPQTEILLAIPILALLWCAILAWEVRRWLVAAATGAVAATFLWTAQRQDAVDRFWDSTTAAPGHVVDDVALAGKTDEIAAVDRRTYTRTNLPRWPIERGMARQLSAQMAQESDDSFAVFGDAPFLYVYFKQRPPFHVELYDGSKRDEQEAIVDALEDEDPNLILWRRDYAQDSVPQAVRNPIVLRWVVDRYVPVRRGALSDVLRRRRPGERAQPRYWHERLGEPLSLGYVPAASGGEDADSCDVGDDGCNAYAVLEGEPSQRDQPLGMVISGRGRSFGVIMLGRPGETEYAVRLDRLWFAPFVGSAPQVDTGVPGFEARLEGHRSGDDLW